MSNVVNKINIKQITASRGREPDSYILELVWDLNGGSSCGYGGSYTATLYQDGVQFKSYNLTDPKKLHTTKLEFSGLDTDKSYTITLSVPASSGGAVSGEETVLLKTFEGLGGILGKDGLKLFWEKPDALVLGGICSITLEDGSAFLYEIPQYTAGHRIILPDLYPSQMMSVVLTPSDGNISYGPNSEILEFFTSSGAIESVEYKAASDLVNLSTSFEHPYENEEGLSVRVFIRQGQAVVYQTDLLNIKKPEHSSYQLEFTKLQADLIETSLRECTMTVSFLRGNAVSWTEDGSNTIFLGTPQITSLEVAKGKVDITWNMDLGCKPSMYLLQHMDEILFVQGNHYMVDLSEDFRCRIAAVYNEFASPVKIGPFGADVNLFKEGYYPSSDSSGGYELTYRQSGFKEDSVCNVFPAELFKERLTKPLTAGALKLDVLETEYHLSLSNQKALTVNEYNEFIEMIKDIITPYGFYVLTDAIARMCRLNTADTAYFSCGYQAEKRIADIRPGMILHVQTELYMPQEDADGDNVSGFVTAHTAEYTASLPMNPKASYIEFDSFINGFADYFSADYSLSGSDNVIYAGGLRDLFTTAARQPYYRVLYPSSLLHSDEADSPYPSDNVIILAADSYGKILSATQSIIDNPANVNRLDIPVILFRGRSTVSLSIKVWLNGEPLKVPAGTTLGSLLERTGIYHCNESTKLFRKNANGKEVTVYLNWGQTSPEGVVLMQGDRVEV